MADRAAVGTTIRRATADDASAVAQLRASFWTTQADLGLKDKRNASHADWRADTDKLISRARTVVLVAESGDGLLGYIYGAVQAAPHLTPPIVKVVEEVFVQPGTVGRGLGARLVAACFEELLPGQTAREQIRVLADNTGGRSFWARQGFADAVIIMERQRIGQA